jgi:hypothetical protein
MNNRKLSRILILGGIVLIVLAIVWFIAAYAKFIDTMSQYGGGDAVSQMLSCLYSTPAICQGANYLSSGPSYSPAVFWIGVLALLAGVVMRFAMSRATTPGGAPAAGVQAAPADGNLLGLLPPEKYTRTTYILVLIGAVCVLVIPPLMIVGLAGFVLALLGMFAFKPRLAALDGAHLTAIAVVFVAASLLLLMTAGSVLFLLVGLVQLALYYIGFNSFRHGRAIGIANLKEEAQFAVKPLTKQPSKPDGGQ